MAKRRLLPALIILFCFSVCIPLAQSSRISPQDISPGASPEWSVGASSASVSVEVFNDYQCPPCATFNEDLKTLELTYKGSVRIVFRNYPLTTYHENALAAAQAAEAAGLQGRFIDMIDLLYARQRYWAGSKNAKQRFISYASALNLDVKRFISDVNGEVVRERIDLDLERAHSLDVKGTPTVLVNGKMLGMYSEVDQAVKDALNRAR